MQTVQIQVDDRYFDSFLALINNLKDGMVQSVKIDDDSLSNIDKQYEINKSYFQNANKELEDGSAKLISHEDVWEKVSAHIKAHS
jgi:ATP-dependent Zn protease